VLDTDIHNKIDSRIESENDRNKKGNIMINNWKDRFSENARDYEGYPIGKTLKLLTDPEIISLAGGLPSPDVFQKGELIKATKNILDDENINKVMQYSSIPGEASLIEAVINFLKRDDINISEENLLITTSGQNGLDLTGRLFLNPGDIVEHAHFGRGKVVKTISSSDIAFVDFSGVGMKKLVLEYAKLEKIESYCR